MKPEGKIKSHNGIVYVTSSGKYKHKLFKSYRIQTTYRPKKRIETEFITLCKNGVLIIKIAYRWNGLTFFPEIKSMIRASLIHDALYELMKERLLDYKTDRNTADNLFREESVKDRTWRIVTEPVYIVLRTMGAGFAKPRQSAIRRVNA